MIESMDYSEVYSAIKALGEDYESRIAPDVWRAIEYERDRNYTPNVDQNKPVDEQGFSRVTMAIIT